MAVTAETFREAPIAAINITPLVDVMLVLLIIFMVSTPLVTRTLDTRLPYTGSATTKGEPVVLEVAIDGYRLDGRAVSADALDRTLARLVRVRPDTVLTVTASQDAEYQQVATALAAAHRNGVRHLSHAP